MSESLSAFPRWRLLGPQRRVVGPRPGPWIAPLRPLLSQGVAASLWTEGRPNKMPCVRALFPNTGWGGRDRAVLLRPSGCLCRRRPRTGLKLVVDEEFKNGPLEWSLLPKMEGVLLAAEGEETGAGPDPGLPVLTPRSRWP